MCRWWWSWIWAAGLSALVIVPFVQDRTFTSFGHLNVLRVEVMQLLEEAFLRVVPFDLAIDLFGRQARHQAVR